MNFVCERMLSSSGTRYLEFGGFVLKLQLYKTVSEYVSNGGISNFFETRRRGREIEGGIDTRSVGGVVCT